jgi:hypothetical protein
MSEFTDGFLFRYEYVEQVSSYMQSKLLPFFARDLNSKWSALFIDDQGLILKSTQDIMMQLSGKAPFMRYIFAEDHGWGYRIYARGQEQANFYEDYGLLHKVALEIAEQRLPHIEDIQYFIYADQQGQEIFAEILSEAKQTEDYKDILSKQFVSKNVQAFANFGASSEVIEELDTLLAYENIDDAERYKLHTRFNKLLEITGMEWLSYDYLSRK